MQHRIITSALIASALLLSASMSRAAETRPATAEQAKPKAAKSAAQVKEVDINSAGKAELKTLPGIGDAEADKIIAGRPYLTKAHLVTHKIIPDGIYFAIKDQVVARQDTKPKK